MKKITSGLMGLAMAVTAVFAFAACGDGTHSAITSNWKFESISSGGKTTRAADLKEDDRPMITIDEDGQNKGEYMVIYRQSGKNHRASMSMDNGKYRIDYVDSDKDMIASVYHNKLTLTIDGSKSGSSIVFVHTIEDVLIPADDDKAAPEFMKAKMTGKGKVEITNEGDSEYMYGRFYQLEVKSNGKWCYARAKESFAWTAVGIVIPAGATNTEEYDLSHYGTLKPGEYRLAAGEQKACIYAYFTVNADGSFLYPD
ncbi:MAG: hypothetical protein K5869_00510 [Saccharofermentans sp.]|nr:hypothetical protein [Saccharofermentans sp.]